ncbi:MAG: glyceraldehyde 3-phosphate dehydrogenase NAD-binding domain-containing protein [Candidatus Woesebacteria bacterium]|jgi:glyceraldehyde 3-phosphate dehydrogenase
MKMKKTKKLRVGINGFGRIGRAIFRINEEKNFFDVVAINDINPDNHNLAYLLKYDTTYGRFSGSVKDNQHHLIVNNKKIGIHHCENISDVPWDEYGIDVLVESSGVKSNLGFIKELKDMVKNVVITYDPGVMDQTIVFGCNEKELNPKKNFLISSSICDSIALSPIVKLLETKYGISHGYLVTLHPWLSYQNLLDGPSKSWSQPGDVFSHYALGRSSIMNIIPKSTSAVTAASKLFKNLEKKLTSFSFRIPTSIVSSAVLIAYLKKDLKQKALIDAFTQFEKKQKHKVFKNTTEPLTSVDYAGEEFSAIIDHRWTKVNQKRLIKLVYWYDNEWGYSSRTVDLIHSIGKFYKKQK